MTAAHLATAHASKYRSREEAEGVCLSKGMLRMKELYTHARIPYTFNYGFREDLIVIFSFSFSLCLYMCKKNVEDVTVNVYNLAKSKNHAMADG